MPISRHSDLKRLEAVFAPCLPAKQAHAPAPPMPALPVHTSLHVEWGAIRLSWQLCACKISTAKGRQVRALIWRDVPLAWRAQVRRAVALILGTRYGTLRSVAQIRAMVAAEVPEDLAGAVTAQAIALRRLGSER